MKERGGGRRESDGETEKVEEENVGNEENVSECYLLNKTNFQVSHNLT